ncbi:ATP synthase mitochondrial F1 complex assembly factor 2 [Quillaja saponaria]|uniref:ATP synthase mitochondrial F1 complex assembly factor 2 n=1 Tax=Quillaja saponaria TaxID=32244 RepID=A0AAD7Q4N9_QUISA|nr:ATP synthase mitochondrial F1 complex assembly factor 2 [Quillaja saponaria]
MPMSFMTGSIVGMRFYKQVTAREADDGIGWRVMLDYRTLKTPSKRPLKLPTHALAKAIAAKWEYHQADGIRPSTMPLMKLACTAMERVPLTRTKISEHLMKKFNQDLVFCHAPDDNALTSNVHDLQVEKIDPLLHWVESEFGFKPVIRSRFFWWKAGRCSCTGYLKKIYRWTNRTLLKKVMMLILPNSGYRYRQLQFFLVYQGEYRFS